MECRLQQLSTLFLSSGDLIADRRFDWAKDCEAKGDLVGAADLLRQALELVPGYASAWFSLGEICDKLGDRSGAIAAFEQARTADPDDRHGASLHLARLGTGNAAMPPAYVRALFDHYAPAFDRALVEGLGYRGPELLRAAVERVCGADGRSKRFGTALDLGCGTGLAGAVFRPLVDWLVGVDLSGGMVAEARKKGLYDRLAAQDVCTFLDGEERTSAHLIVAADVFVYFADLVPVLAAAARVLDASGLFAFTTETHDGEGVILRETLRYAHAESHVRAALEAAGLKPLLLEPTSTRTEKQLPVPGLLVVAAPTASPFVARA